MPETTTVPTPPTETLSSRTSFASCPPEEERETQAQAPQAARAGAAESAASSAETNAAPDERVITQQPTPEPDTPTLLPSDKARFRDNAGVAADLTSDIASPDANALHGESEARLAQSMAIAAISSDVPRPMYLCYPQDRERVRTWHTRGGYGSELTGHSRLHRTRRPPSSGRGVSSEAPSSPIARSTMCRWRSRTLIWPSHSSVAICASKVRLLHEHDCCESIR